MRHRSIIDPPVLGEARMDYLLPFDHSTRKSSTVSTVQIHQSGKDMEDVVVENYQARSAQGGIFNNPMSQSSWIVTQSIGSWNNTLGVYPRDDGTIDKKSGYIDVGMMSGSYFCGDMSVPPTRINVDRLRNIAVTQAWANIDQSEIDGIATLLELKETVLTLRSILWRLLKIKRKLQKLDFQYFRKLISFRQLSDAYLEARYAIRPLYYDVNGVIKAFHKKVEDPRQTFRGFQRDSDEYSLYETCTWPTSYRYDVERTVEDEITVRAGVLVQVTLSKILNALQPWGMDKPFEAIWEVTPYSFIIDWFFNIGQTISAWTPNAGLSPLASWVVVERNAAITSVASNFQVEPGIYAKQSERARTVSSGPGTVLRRIKTVDRTPDPHRPVLPSLNIRLDFLKSLDGVLIAWKR